MLNHHLKGRYFVVAAFLVLSGMGQVTMSQLLKRDLRIENMEKMLNRKPLSESARADDGYELNWNADLVKLVSFGQIPTVIDFLWMESLQNQKRFGLYPRLRLLSDLDGAFFEVYFHGANLLTVVHDDHDGARNLLLKGELFRTQILPPLGESFSRQFWPSHWRVPMPLAYVLLYEFNDLPAASLALQKAGTERDAPHFLTRLKKKLLTTEGEYEVGIKLLRFMISNAPDQIARDRLAKKHERLSLGYFPYQLNKNFQEFAARQQRSGIKPRSLWKVYQNQLGSMGLRDAMGGSLYWDDSGKILSTRYEGPVLNMAY